MDDDEGAQGHSRPCFTALLFSGLVRFLSIDVIVLGIIMAVPALSLFIPATMQ